MNIDKSIAEKKLIDAPSNKTSAIWIHRDSTVTDKTILLKKVIKDIERKTRKGIDVTVVTIED